MAKPDPKDMLEGLGGSSDDEAPEDSDDGGGDSVAAMADFLDAIGQDSSKAVAADKALKAWLALADQA